MMRRPLPEKRHDRRRLRDPDLQIPEPGVAASPEPARARERAGTAKLLYELNAAYDRAAHDDDVRVIVLAAEGGLTLLGRSRPLREHDPAGAMRRYRTVAMCGFGCAGAEAQMSREEEIYTGFCERWRNLPKPTIAAVQGECIAGGLMLVWPCDLIVASDDASFADPVVSLGVGSRRVVPPRARARRCARPRSCCSRARRSAPPKPSRSAW